MAATTFCSCLKTACYCQHQDCVHWDSFNFSLRANFAWKIDCAYQNWEKWPLGGQNEILEIATLFQTENGLKYLIWMHSRKNPSHWIVPTDNPFVSDSCSETRRRWLLDNYFMAIGYHVTTIQIFRKLNLWSTNSGKRRVGDIWVYFSPVEWYGRVIAPIQISKIDSTIFTTVCVSPGLAGRTWSAFVRRPPPSAF